MSYVSKDMESIKTHHTAPAPYYISCVAKPPQLRDAEASPLPILKSWRCELTALSRTDNLYFVASGTEINVFQPIYPDQTLVQPALRFCHRPSADNLHGYIDLHEPHSINRLHVDYLGRKEILLTASDDGDVVGYYISAIQAAIATEQSTEDSEHFTGNIKPFFRINVRKSAWGLAVHRQARLIAISANTRRVTVVAFKLTRTSDHVHKRHNHMMEADGPYTLLRLPAANNIPSVSFNNTGTDPSGRWLLGSVIDGNTHLWDLHHPHEGARKLSLGYCIQKSRDEPFATHGDCDPFQHGAWGAIFLDPRCCHPSKSIKDAFGGPPRVRNTCIWDTTVSVSKVPPGPDLSRDGPATINWPSTFQELADQHDDYYDVGAILEEVSNYDDGADYSDEDDSVADGNTGDEGTPVNHHPAYDVGTSNQLNMTGNDGNDDDNVLHVLNQPDIQIPAVQDQFGPLIASKPKAFYIDSTSERRDISTTLSHDENLELPPIAILTRSEVYLLQLDGFFNAENGSRFGPTIAMYRPCATKYRELDTFYLDHQSPSLQLRLSLHIPELGLFIVSEKTRCAVFSVTSVANPEDGQVIHGFRREFLLPFDSDPRYNHMSGLIGGIAAGPVQGQMDRGSTDGEVDEEWDVFVEKPRTWRLFLYREKGHVQVYELSRARRDMEPTVADLII